MCLLFFDNVVFGVDAHVVFDFADVDGVIVVDAAADCCYCW